MSAAWCGWTMLLLFLCAVFSEVMQPGIISQSHVSIMARTERTYKDAPTNTPAQFLISIFRIGTLAMAICLCEYAGGSFRFASFAAVCGLVLAFIRHHRRTFCARLPVPDGGYLYPLAQCHLVCAAVYRNAGGGTVRCITLFIFENDSLYMIKILFSQPRPETAHNPYSRLEEQFDVQCDFHQFIHIEGLSAREFRQQHINPMDYTAVILNSKLGAEHYFRLCEEMRLNVPDSMHYYCNSEQVGLYLQKFINYRKRKVFFPETGNKFEDLLPAMHRRPNERYLMVLSNIHTKDQINMFAENGVEVTPAIMYRTVTTPWPQDMPFEYDMIALFTPAGVTSLNENFPNWKQGRTLIAAFGEGTIRALDEAGYRVDIEAGPGKAFASLPMAIADYLDKNQ